MRWRSSQRPRDISGYTGWDRRPCSELCGRQYGSGREFYPC